MAGIRNADRVFASYLGHVVGPCCSVSLLGPKSGCFIDMLLTLNVPLFPVAGRFYLRISEAELA